MATLTIKGNTSKKKKIIDDFQNLCLANETLTQDEVLEMLMDTDSKEKQATELYEKDALLYAALVGKYVTGTGYENVDGFIRHLQMMLNSANEFEVKLADILGMSLDYQAILREVEELATARILDGTEKQAKKGLSENNNILEDIREFKSKENASLPNLDFGFTEKELAEDISEEEALEVAGKFSVVYNYMKGLKPDITPKEVALTVLDSVYDEIMESKKA